MASALGVVGILAIVIMFLHLAVQFVAGYFAREQPTTEEAAMTAPEPGKHRRSTDVRPAIPDQFAELAKIEDTEVWKVTHHVFEPIEFSSDTEVYEHLLSVRQGRATAWRVWLPQAVTWKTGMKENISSTEFLDYYFDTHAASLLKG